MYIKISPTQNLRMYCFRYRYLENVKASMDMFPPTKVLPESFFCTYAFLGKNNELYFSW
jgi:hypothetical protein